MPPNTHERLLNNVSFIYFLVYGIVFVGSVAVLNPFISLWAGENYLLSPSIVIVHSFNIYIFGTMSSVWAFRSTMGLFKYGRWRPLYSAIINVVVSIWWAKVFGIIGVLMGTTFTRVVTNLWYDPMIVYKYGLEKKPFGYYWRWMIGFAIVSFDAAGIICLQHFVPMDGLLAILFYGFSAVIIFGLSVLLIYHKSEEFYYALKVIRKMLAKFQKGVLSARGH